MGGAQSRDTFGTPDWLWGWLIMSAAVHGKSETKYELLRRLEKVPSLSLLFPRFPLSTSTAVSPFSPLLVSLSWVHGSAEVVVDAGSEARILVVTPLSPHIHADTHTPTHFRAETDPDPGPAPHR